MIIFTTFKLKYNQIMMKIYIKTTKKIFQVLLFIRI